MTEQIPRSMEMLGNSLVDSNGADLGECSKLRTASWSALKPNKKWDIIGGDHDVVIGSSE